MAGDTVSGLGIPGAGCSCGHLPSAEPGATSSASSLCWGLLGTSKVGVRKRGGAVSYDAVALHQSCSDLSSTSCHHSKPQPGCHQTGIRDQGHLDNGLQLTLSLFSLKEGFAKPLGNRNQSDCQRRAWECHFQKHGNVLLYPWCDYRGQACLNFKQECLQAGERSLLPKVNIVYRTFLLKPPVIPQNPVPFLP